MNNTRSGAILIPEDRISKRENEKITYLRCGHGCERRIGSARIRSLIRALLCLLIALPGMLALSGCKSYWVDATIQNQTGQPVQELEVDYPTASFGTNSLSDGAAMQYRFKIRGSGPIKVIYTAPDGGATHTVQAQGLNIYERQSGQLTVLLLPGGKVKFLDHLQPAS